MSPSRAEMPPQPLRRLPEAPAEMARALAAAHEADVAEALSRVEPAPAAEVQTGLPVGVQIAGFVVLGGRETASLALGAHDGVDGRKMDPARHMVGLTTSDITEDRRRLKDARRRVRRGSDEIRHLLGRDLEGSRR